LTLVRTVAVAMPNSTWSGTRMTMIHSVFLIATQNSGSLVNMNR
jgi:hypothetical protein